MIQIGKAILAIGLLVPTKTAQAFCCGFDDIGDTFDGGGAGASGDDYSDGPFDSDGSFWNGNNGNDSTNSAYNPGYATSKYGYYPNGNYPLNVPAEYRVSVDGLLGPETAAKIADYPELAAQYGLAGEGSRCSDGGSGCGATDDNVRAFQEAFNTFVDDDYGDDVSHPGSDPGPDTCTQVTRYSDTQTGQCVGSWSSWQPYSASEEKRTKHGTMTTVNQVWEFSYTRHASSCVVRDGGPPIPDGAQGVSYETTVESCQEIEFRPLTILYVEWCMDPSADNYNRYANIDNGTHCVYTGGGNVNTPPYISLDGSRFINVVQGVLYNEPGYAAFDAQDGVITNEVVVSGSVDHETLGTYTIRYNVTDSAGARAQEATRRVAVVPYRVECPQGQSYDSGTDRCVITSCPAGETLIHGACQGTATVDGETTGSAAIECSLDQDWSDNDNNCDQEFVLARNNQPIYLNAVHDLGEGCSIDTVNWSLESSANSDPSFGLDQETSNTEQTSLLLIDQGSSDSKFIERTVYLDTSALLGCTVPRVAQTIDIKLLDIEVTEE